MPKINFNQAKEFLNNITSEDKVAVVHHDDGDGFCSGILLYDWCKKKEAEVKTFTFSIGKSKAKEYDLENFNKILIADLAPGPIQEILEAIKEKEVLYLDHHPEENPVPDKILELRTIKDGYIPSSRTAQELTEIKPWLGLIGTISDMGYLRPENEKYIKRILDEEGFSLEDFKDKITSVFTNTLIYFNKDTDKVFDIIKNLNSIKDIKKLKQYSDPVENEIQKFVNEYKEKRERLGNVNFYYIDPKFSVKSAVSSILSRNNTDEIFILANPRGNNVIALSARNIVGKLTAKKVLAAGLANLKDANSGGHEVSAGGQLYTKDLEQFKKNVREYLAITD